MAPASTKWKPLRPVGSAMEASMAVFPKLPLLKPFSERTAYFFETASSCFLLCHFRRKWHTCQKSLFHFHMSDLARINNQILLFADYKENMVKISNYSRCRVFRVSEISRCRIRKGHERRVRSHKSHEKNEKLCGASASR